MIQEEKQLLLKDLCARLPYGVKINIRNDYTLTMEDMEMNAYHLSTISYEMEYRGLRPYLRPMSSMTDEENKEYIGICTMMFGETSYLKYPYLPTDWLDEHHFDYRGLIEKGLALNAPDGMYETE